MYKASSGIQGSLVIKYIRQTSGKTYPKKKEWIVPSENAAWLKF